MTYLGMKKMLHDQEPACIIYILFTKKGWNKHVILFAQRMGRGKLLHLIMKPERWTLI